jgi:hypothetical protein
MPEVQEVFRMATQKVRPDPGFIDRQSDHRRKQERRRKIGAFAMVAVIGAVAVVLVIRSGRDERQRQPAAERQSQPATPTPSGVGDGELLGPPWGRRVSRIVAGIPFSFKVPTQNWENSPGMVSQAWPRDFSINKDVWGPQGAEAIIFWTSFPDGGQADPCPGLLSAPIGRTAADLAAAVATAPGTQLVRGPSDVTVGGHAARHVVLTVREEVGCDPGFFYTWPHGECRGACWLNTRVGDTIRVWIVDVGGTRLFIEAETTKHATRDLEQEIQQIVKSIRFD